MTLKELSNINKITRKLITDYITNNNISENKFAKESGIDDSFDIGFSSKDDTNFNVFIKQFKKSKMKKVMMIMAVALMAMSCKKKEVTPCNCGEIMSDNAADYSVDIKNDCSGNFKTFVLTPDDWMSAYVGTHYCITNTTSW